MACDPLECPGLQYGGCTGTAPEACPTCALQPGGQVDPLELGQLFDEAVGLLGALVGDRRLSSYWAFHSDCPCDRCKALRFLARVAPAPEGEPDGD